MSPLAAAPQRQIFITGMFDMMNYGDLLFPLIARQRLAPYGIDVAAVAPSASPALLADAMPTRAIDALFSPGETCGGVLIGGGYVIHCHTLDFFETYDAGARAGWAGPGLWLGATLAAVLRGVPVMWNAPGAPHPLGGAQRGLAGAALRAAEYVSFRDRGSQEVLRAPPDVNACIVPDTAAGIPASTRQTVGRRNSATLVRGRDHGHFDLEAPPEDDFHPDALARHRQVLRQGADVIYKDGPPMGTST